MDDVDRSTHSGHTFEDPSEAAIEAERDTLAAVAFATAPLLSRDRSAVSIVAEVHDDWLNVRYDAERDGGMVRGVDVDADTNDLVVDALLDMRSAMLAGGQPDWHHCVFRLAADGRFRLDIDRDRPATV